MLPSSREPRRSIWLAVCAALLSTAPVLADDEDRASYSYARVVDGPSTVLAEGGARESVEPHQPVLVGDSLWVPEGSRLEVVLADRNLLRFEGESDLAFERIAYSAETGDRETQLRLREAQLQLVVPEDALGDAYPRIETESGTIFIHQPGSYLIRTGRSGTELVVREGLAELVTDRGSLLIHPDELGWAEGGYRGNLDVYAAGRRESLERWGDRLTEEAALASATYVDPSLRYAAAPLESNGAWIEVHGRRAWRPRVEVSWRPYYRGYWRHTPVGYTWVSYDPWGWVTHHYGSWDYDAGFGWVWYPGRVYAPARVTWYWGPDYVGWCPTGYYAHHYRPRRSGFGLRFGIFGHAGGSWSPFSHWTFTASLHFGDGHRHRRDRHRGHGYRPWHDYDTGRRLASRGRRLNRGWITTDVGLERRRPEEIYRDLERRAENRRRTTGRALPDVTDFVARKPLDNDDVRRAVEREPRSRNGQRGRGDWDLGDAPWPNVTQVLRDKPRTAVVNGGGRGGSRPTAGSSPRRPTGRQPTEPRTTTRDRREPVAATQILRERRRPDTPAPTARVKPGSPEASVKERPSESPRTRRPTAVLPGKPLQSGRIQRDETTRPTPARPTEPRQSVRIQRDGASGSPRVRPSQPRTSPRVQRNDTTSTPRVRPSQPRTSTRAPRSEPSRPTTSVRPSERRQPPARSPRASAGRSPSRDSAGRSPSRDSSARATPRPTPRATAPRATPRPTPRASAPRATPRPTPRASAPRATPRPTPRASAPRATPRPTPRASAPPRSSSKPRASAPRASQPRAEAKPAPSKPSKPSKPAASKPKRNEGESKPAASKERGRTRPRRD